MRSETFKSYKKTLLVQKKLPSTLLNVCVLVSNTTLKILCDTALEAIK